MHSESSPIMSGSPLELPARAIDNGDQPLALIAPSEDAIPDTTGVLPNADNSGTETPRYSLWQAIAEIEGFDTGQAVESQEPEKPKKGVLGWIRRNKVLAGAGIVSVGSLVANPLGDTLKSLGEAAPAVGVGLLLAEVVWIGGAAVALAAPGKDGQRTPLPRTFNPLQLSKAIKTRFNEIGEGAENSPWFKTGFAINGIAMLAQFAIPAAGIVANFAPKAWGLLAWPVLELAGALVMRREILKRVHGPRSTTD